MKKKLLETIGVKWLALIIFIILFIILTVIAIITRDTAPTVFNDGTTSDSLISSDSDGNLYSTTWDEQVKVFSEPRNIPDKSGFVLENIIEHRTTLADFIVPHPEYWTTSDGRVWYLDTSSNWQEILGP